MLCSFVHSINRQREGLAFVVRRMLFRMFSCRDGGIHRAQNNCHTVNEKDSLYPEDRANDWPNPFQ